MLLLFNKKTDNLIERFLDEKHQRQYRKIHKKFINRFVNINIIFFLGIIL